MRRAWGRSCRSGRRDRANTCRGRELGRAWQPVSPGPRPSRACRSFPAGSPCSAASFRSLVVQVILGASLRSSFPRRRRRREVDRPGPAARRPAPRPSAGERTAARRTGALDHQLREHRQRHRAGQERQPYHDGSTTQLLPTRSSPGLGRPVVEPGRDPDLLTAPGTGVIDRGQSPARPRRPAAPPPAAPGQAQAVSVQRAPGEERVRTVMAPQPGQPAPVSMPHTVRLPGLGEETAGQAAERAERRGGEQRAEGGQQARQRGGKR